MSCCYVPLLTFAQRLDDYILLYSISLLSFKYAEAPGAKMKTINMRLKQMSHQDRDLAVLRRAARRLAEGSAQTRALSDVKESKVDSRDTFRRCTMVYPEEMMFCMMKVTKMNVTLAAL